MSNGTISQTTFTDTEKISKVNITQLREAVLRLETYVEQVDNCGNCTGASLCQSATCQNQTCQTTSCQTTTCQSCQSCQTCQSQTCQSCQNRNRRDDHANRQKR